MRLLVPLILIAPLGVSLAQTQPNTSAAPMSQPRGVVERPQAQMESTDAERPSGFTTNLTRSLGVPPDGDSFGRPTVAKDAASRCKAIKDGRARLHVGDADPCKGL